MASVSGDAEGSTEDVTGRKKSKLKSLKTRIFGRSKRGSVKKNPKLSQSESDITSGKGLGSEEDLSCPQGMMPSRALSHDSIFIDDQDLNEGEPARVSSQENVQGRIKALQVKLQQQKMHLGPPPLVLPRRPEDPDGRSDEDNLSGSPAEISNTSPQSSHLISPIPKPSPTKYQTLPAPSTTSVDESPSDFSSPAQLTPRLDTSAARHRMSVKPRNQRAGSKKKIGDSDSLNNIDHPDSDSDKEQQPNPQEKVALETQVGETVAPSTVQILSSKLPEVVPITSEAENKSKRAISSQPDQIPHETVPPVPSQILRVKGHRIGEVVSGQRPQSCILPSEMKDKIDESFEISLMSRDKRNTLNSSSSGDQRSSIACSEETFRSTSPQQVQYEAEGTLVIKRSSQGTGSFHFSVTTTKNIDGERPRSDSFEGVLEKAEGRHRYEKKPILSTKEKEELRELQLRGATSAAGRLRQGATQQTGSDFLIDKRESLKRVEPVAPSTGETTDTAAAQEGVKDEEEKQEAQQEDGKLSFGIKLRSTSQSTRLRSESTSSQNTAVSEEQGDKTKVEEMSNNTSNKSRSQNTIPSAPLNSGDLRQADQTLPGISSPVKKTPPSADSPRIMPTEVQTVAKVETSSFNLIDTESIPAAPQEPPPSPHSSSSDVSWMSLAMEKTKSFQQLFTRFPRDFSGTAPRPQAQVPPVSQAPTQSVVQVHAQTLKMQQNMAPLEAPKQPPADAVKADTVQSKGQVQIVKPSSVAVQQKTSMTSPVKSQPLREPFPLKQTSQFQPPLNTTPSAPHQTLKTTAQSPLHSATKTQTPSQPIQPPLHSAIKTQTPSQPVQPSLHSATKISIPSQPIQPPVQSATKIQTPSQPTQPPSQSATKTLISPFAKGGTTQSLAQSYLSSGQQQQQQPPWSNRALQSTNQFKSTTPAPSSVPAAPSAASPAPDSAPEEKKETTVQEKEPAPVSVSQRAAFLEKRTERISPPATKGVELRKAQTEAQTSGETPAPAKASQLIRDTKPEGRPWVRPAESSPTKIPDRPHDDKWPKKNVVSSPARSLSPTVPSPIQSMSDSGQPSWMELAKRKSMAWSDKSMD
ncbi:proteoglycan 4 [Xyrichtys novacula]|uniref:Proteoglycan 4 n=1 Tax=Xyrichtys novacula TaxID=13765 RepID=A0AAV1H1L1_XYRNO|nr:proteoglycan 4 [Xyrichtys novacula]